MRLRAPATLLLRSSTNNDWRMTVTLELRTPGISFAAGLPLSPNSPLPNPELLDTISRREPQPRAASHVLESEHEKEFLARGSDLPVLRAGGRSIECDLDVNKRRVVQRQQLEYRPSAKQ